MSLVAATFYSASLRLKRFPVVGTLVNVLIFAPLPLLAAAHRPSLRMQFLTYCFWVLVTQNQILHEIADGREDATGGVRTTGVVVGAVGLRVHRRHPGAAGRAAAVVAADSAPWRCSPRLWGFAGARRWSPCATRERAGQLRVAHRWFSLGVGAVLFALVATGGA